MALSIRKCNIHKPFRRPLLQPWCISRTAFNVHRLPRSSEDEPEDFRPSWLYTAARVLSWTLIPATAIYGVFFYDFGSHDHVFQPPRRWLEKQKLAFFTLSADEKKIVDNSPKQTEAG